jgi:uncharacterized protein (DUF2225 family)
MQYPSYAVRLVVIVAQVWKYIAFQFVQGNAQTISDLSFKTETKQIFIATYDIVTCPFCDIYKLNHM